MASNRGLAYRRERADERVRLALDRIATRLAVELPDAPPRRRGANEEAVAQVELWADRIEALDAALKDEGYSAAPGKEGKQPAAALSVATPAATPAAMPARAPETPRKARKG